MLHFVASMVALVLGHFLYGSLADLTGPLFAHFGALVVLQLVVAALRGGAIRPAVRRASPDRS